MGHRRALAGRGALVLFHRRRLPPCRHAREGSGHSAASRHHPPLRERDLSPAGPNDHYLLRRGHLQLAAQQRTPFLPPTPELPARIHGPACQRRSADLDPRPRWMVPARGALLLRDGTLGSPLVLPPSRSHRGGERRCRSCGEPLPTRVPHRLRFARGIPCHPRPCRRD